MDDGRPDASAGAGDDDFEAGAYGLHTGHDIKQVLRAAAAEKHDIDFLIGGQIHLGGGAQFEIGIRVEQGAKAHETEWVAFDNGDTNGCLFCQSRLHKPSGKG